MKYEEFVDSVEYGMQYKINLIQKTLFLDKKEIDIEYQIGDWAELERLYQNYKRSIPSQFMQGNKPYFIALPYDKLEDYELLYNENRNIAQAKLEGYILFSKFKWQNNKHWFFIGKDSDFVVLKDFIKEA